MRQDKDTGPNQPVSENYKKLQAALLADTKEGGARVQT